MLVSIGCKGLDTRPLYYIHNHNLLYQNVQQVCCRTDGCTYSLTNQSWNIFWAVHCGTSCKLLAVVQFYKCSEEMTAELKRCVECTYRVQIPQNRAVKLILLWSLLVLCSVSLLKGILLEKLYFRNIVWQIVLNYSFTFSVFVFYPLSSFLGDIYLKRFSIVKASLFLLWLGALVSVAILVLEYVYHLDTPLSPKSAFFSLYIVLYLFLSIGVIGFHANLIPFGLEQLHVSPAEEVVTFLHCYIFTEAFGLVIANAFIPNCATIPNNSNTDRFVLFQSATCAIIMTVAFAFIPLVRHLGLHIVEDPALYNPLHLICRVFVHIIKTRSWPSQCSVWWTDAAAHSSLLSFTTGQVDDVRAFFYLIPILLPYFVVMIGNVTTVLLAMFVVHLNWHGNNWHGLVSPETCFPVTIIGNLPGITAMLCIIVYNFIIYPIFYKYIPNMLSRLIIGILFFVASTLCCLIIELVYHQEDNSLFMDTALDSGIKTLNISFTWAIVPGLLSGTANFIFTASIYEFICAQAPCGMKGLLVGLKYGVAGLGVLIGFGMLCVFKSLNQNLDYLYYFLNMLVFVISIIIMLLYKHWYIPFRSYRFDTHVTDSGDFLRGSTAL